MIYGAPPFYHLNTFQKMRAIPDPNHIIEFPAVAVPTIKGERGLVEVRSEEAVAVPEQVIEVLRSCLKRQPKARATIPEILASPWLTQWSKSSSYLCCPSPDVLRRRLVIRKFDCCSRPAVTRREPASG